MAAPVGFLAPKLVPDPSSSIRNDSFSQGSVGYVFYDPNVVAKQPMGQTSKVEDSDVLSTDTRYSYTEEEEEEEEISLSNEEEKTNQ